MQVFSFGGGVQSTAAMILSANRIIDYSIFIFANVGNDSENPDTISYFHNVISPYAKIKGLELHEITHDESLYERLVREEKSIRIPVRLNKTGFPTQRWCTQNYKIKSINNWLGKGQHIVGLGISIDEYQRMRNDSGYKNIINEYPLISKKISRNDCLQIIKNEGLPIPAKSSCWFCPFHTMETWREMRRSRPDLFNKAADLELLFNNRRAIQGKEPVFLTAKGKPISAVIGNQKLLFEEESPCVHGYCFV